ncbi:tail assembly protein [Yersinia massiliensis]|uniref:Phage tail protein n=1 Tax=Yersinia massiliensis TaxID=419257 RepID=A0ABM6UUA8_9GAMM|nr:tail assembly protein [Yersinia massiliensis]AVX37921.1 phage tail protein [Yersinia massiliensis]QKJ12704.1 tail assembly protein [Yersinia massiliensis]
MKMRRKIELSGILGKKFGREYNWEVSSPAEAIQALRLQIKGFKQFLLDSESRGLTFAVFSGKRNIDENELSLGGNAPIRIVPVYIGSKKAGLFQTILGAVLIAATFWNPTAALMSAGFAKGMLMAGASMALGGVLQMLSPQQGGLATRQSAENTPSYAFGGPVNTVAQGNPIPIGYGERIIGGAIISAGIYTEDQM